MVNIHDLPPEILIRVFDITFQQPFYQRRIFPYYVPFFNGYKPQRQDSIYHLLDLPPPELGSLAKATLPLVCKYWRELVLSTVHGDMIILERMGSDALMALQTSEAQFPGYGFGRFVRHIVLWHGRPDPPRYLFNQKRRPFLTNMNSTTSEPVLPDDMFTSVRRLDWLHDPSATFDTQEFFSVGPSIPDRVGLNTFCALMTFTSFNLQYLSISIIKDGNFLPTERFHSSVSLPVLKVLCVCRIGEVLRGVIEAWHLPSLTHLITDSSLTRGTMSSLFSPQIEVVEFKEEKNLLYQPFEVLVVLSHCPGLRELNFYADSVEFVLPRYGVLECVRLNLANAALKRLMNTERNLTMLADPEGSFPSLKRVIFHGSWLVYIDDPKYTALFDRIRERGCVLENEDGTSFPQQIDVRGILSSLRREGRERRGHR